MLKSNKKGFVIGTLVTFYAILTLVLVFIIFFMIIKFENAKVQANIRSETAGSGINKLFINYLRLPFMLEDGNPITTAELYSRVYIKYGSTKQEENLYEDYELQAKMELMDDISKKIDPSGRMGQDLGYTQFYLPPYNYDNKFITVTPMFIPEK